MKGQLLTALVDRKPTDPTTATANKSKPLTDKQRKVFAHTHYIVNHGSPADAFNFLQHKPNVSNTPADMIPKRQAM